MLVSRMWLMLALSLLAVDLRAADLQILFFTMEGCPPCHQTEPNIDRLQQSGVTVSKIDVRQQSAYAASCGVTQTPTILLVEDSRVLARHTGAMTWVDLQQMVANHQPTQQVAVEAPGHRNPANQNQNVAASAGAALTPEQRALQATVRLRIEDGEGTSFATGTIIHCVENEALVLTCGHVFRDANGEGSIHADLGFHLGEPVTVTGSLIAWDADKHDIALVAIPCTLAIEPVPVAPEMLAMQTGDRLFSFGCDRGEIPSVRQTLLKSVTNYSGVSKYDIVGRPVDGRSGGGLFTLGGQLVGVCNAAAVEVDEGIYTGLASVYWQFASSNLSHLFRASDPSGPQLTGTVPRTEPETPSLQPVSLRDAVPSHALPPIRPPALPLRRSGSPLEVIILVRSADDPGQTEAITVRDPDARLLEWIEEARQENSTRPIDPRMAAGELERPDLPRTLPRGESLMRAQSPR